MNKKLALVTTIITCFSMLLGGCGKKMTVEDAPVYVQAVLDARYKADYAAYVEYKRCTEEEAQQLHEQGLDSVMNICKVAGASVSADLKNQFRQLFTDLHRISKYSVGTAQKDGNGFTVEVAAQPFGMFGDISQGMIDAINTEEARSLTTDEQIHQLVYEKMYDLMSAKVSAPSYETAETVTLHIQPDSNKVQTISEADLAALDAVIYTALQ